MAQALQAARPFRCQAPALAHRRPCRLAVAPVRCSSGSAAPADEPTAGDASRRQLLGRAALGVAAAAAAATADVAPAAALPGFTKDLDAAKKRRLTIPESQYSEGPQGLK